MLAQAVTGTPGHINSMARSVKHFIAKIPASEMKEGDHYVTNDPWLGTGHLNDIVVTSPAFHKGKMVGLFSCTVHVMDIGGIGLAPEGRQVFHEGLYIPIMPLARQGVVNQWLIDLVRANVREPVQVEGDIYSLMACNETGERRLSAMLAENGMDDLEVLGEHIIARSREAVLKEIAALPKGTWKSHMRIDGMEAPIRPAIHAHHRRGPYRMWITLAPPARAASASTARSATPTAYTAFGLRCIIGPEIPNNAGTLDLIQVTAPEGSIVNALFPAPVNARSTMGHMMPDVVFGASTRRCPAACRRRAPPACGT
jgi:N-methylhydantoinase B